MPTPPTTTAPATHRVNGIPVRQKFNAAAWLLATILGVVVGIWFGNSWAALVAFIAALAIYAKTTVMAVPLVPPHVGLVFFMEQLQVNDVLREGVHFGLVPGFFKLQLRKLRFEVPFKVTARLPGGDARETIKGNIVAEINLDEIESFFDFESKVGVAEHVRSLAIKAVLEWPYWPHGNPYDPYDFQAEVWNHILESLDCLGKIRCGIPTPVLWRYVTGARPSEKDIFLQGEYADPSGWKPCIAERVSPDLRRAVLDRVSLVNQFALADGLDAPPLGCKLILMTLHDQYDRPLVTVDSKIVKELVKEGKSQAATNPSAAVAASPGISADSAGGLEALLGQLNNLTGLRQVKQDVAALANFIKVQQLRRALGLNTPEISLHMVFYGNPGTGKTTVARLLSKIYKSLGVIRKEDPVETDRSGLVEGHIGGTALKVKAVAEKALGGILFIDEAYALKRSDDARDFGNEAIETLLKFMEDNRHDLVVIVAGYPVEMKRFLNANPGLESRFNKSLSFPDYEPDELMEIFLRRCNESDYRLSEPAYASLSKYFHSAYQNRDSKFGNARLVRNVFDKAITNAACRIAKSHKADISALASIEESDIIAAC